MSNMVVRTNVFALNAHRNMKNVGLEQSRASNRLSSGFRINSAADDAAGLAISETMRAQIRGLDQASRNAQDGQAMLLTTEGGLEEIGNMLQRTRELLNQAANDTNTQQQRQMIEQEITQLGQEIAGMQQRVEFNTNQVLNIGNHGNIRVDIAEAQIAFASAQVLVAEAAASFATRVGSARTLFASAENMAQSAYTSAMRNANSHFQSLMAIAASLSASGKTEAAAAMREQALAQFEADRAQARAERDQSIASATLILQSAVKAATSELTSARSTFEGATHKFLGELRSQFVAISDDLDGLGVAWFQVGANGDQGITFDFATVSQAVLVSGQLVDGIAQALVTAGTSRESGIGYGITISPMIDVVDDALNSINSVRANLGAVQNRMDYTMRSLDISSENLQDSESRVRNTDIAREMMRFTMSNVLQQAAVSMLAQANQLPNNLLQLLR